MDYTGVTVRVYCVPVYYCTCLLCAWVDCIFLTPVSVGVEAEGWGVWEATEGQGPDGRGARGADRKSVRGEGNIYLG